MDSQAVQNHLSISAHDRNIITCLEFDDDKILTASEAGTIQVHDIKSGTLRASLTGHEGGIWGIGIYGNTLVSGSTDKTVRVWDVARAECTHVFHGHSSTVRCIQIVPPSPGRAMPVIVSASRDSTLRVWRLPRPGDEEPGDTDCPYLIHVLSGHEKTVRAIAAHDDTVVSGSYDCTVRVWRISTGESVHKLQGHTKNIYSVVLDHERNRCISGSMDNTIKVWSLDTGSLVYNLEGHTSLVSLLDLRDNLLVSGSADSTLRIWNPDTGECLQVLRGQTGAITCFQHDGHKVIAGSGRDLTLWDVRTGERLRDLLTDLDGVWQVRFDGQRCVAAVMRNKTASIQVFDLSG
ncbi:hypothetical protein VTN96DRAFT_3289 [Rasamsonia emersonii]